MKRIYNEGRPVCLFAATASILETELRSFPLTETGCAFCRLNAWIGPRRKLGLYWLPFPKGCEAVYAPDVEPEGDLMIAVIEGPDEASHAVVCDSKARVIHDPGSVQPEPGARATVYGVMLLRGEASSCPWCHGSASGRSR